MKIELDEYEAVNLLWLMNLVVGPDALVPFSYAYTGDWGHQIKYKLEQLPIVLGTKPNSTRKEMEDRIQRYFR